MCSCSVGSGGRKRGRLRNGCIFWDAWGVDGGNGVESRKRGAVEETGRRDAGGEERSGRISCSSVGSSC